MQRLIKTQKKLGSVFAVLALTVFCSAVAKADEPNPLYLWANFGQFSPQLQSLWLEIIDDKNGWDLCRQPAYSRDGRLVVMTLCQLKNNQLSQWATFIAESSSDGIRGANVLEAHYGKVYFQAELWHWRWTGDLAK